MKASIEVSSRTEADQIRAGLGDAKTRALVKIIGALSELPTDRARQRVLAFVLDVLGEEAEE